MCSNARILIIELETLVALEIQDRLAERGYPGAQHFRTVAEAEQHVVGLLEYDLVIVEARLGADDVVAFTRRLVEAGVPTVILSADEAATTLFPHSIALAKPFDTETLLAACCNAASLRDPQICGSVVTWADTASGP
jgi:DNA-binding response OmpR family regulator